MQTRPFRILGVQQIAIGATDKNALHTLWVDLLGLQKIGDYESAAENVREEILVTGNALGQVEIDLMEPMDPDARPRVHEPALNHIGLWVDDLETAVSWLAEKGVRFTPGGIRKGASGHNVCFIHPKPNSEFPQSGVGVLIELVQAPRELIDAAKTGEA